MEKELRLSVERITAGSKQGGQPSELLVEPNEKGEVSFTFGVEKIRDALLPEMYLSIALEATMERMAVVLIDFINEKENRTLTVRYFMIPKRRVTLAVKLDELDSHRFFLPTYPGTFKGHLEGEPMRLEEITKIQLRLKANLTCTAFRLYGVWLSAQLPNMRVPGAPLVDRFGQRADAEWPNKIHDEKELIDYLRAEKERAERDNHYPEGFTRFGGWAEKKFDQTGYFHTHFDGRRWWLVDPDGYAFISNGVCYGSRMGVHGFTDKMESLFEWMPDENDEEWNDCRAEASDIAEFVKRNGKESGKGRGMFNFARANMIRAFGAKGWWDAWVQINAARLKRWGMNTIGVGVNNYEDEHVKDYLEKAKIPYVWTLKQFPLTEHTIYRDFPDVFSPEYVSGSERFAKEQLSSFAGDPYMIGYFITNEPEWLFQANVNPAERVLAYPGKLFSKDAMIGFLKERYDGKIEKLNEAWGLHAQSFEELKNPLEHADRLSPSSERDLGDFRDVLIKKYSSVPSEALRRVDPDHLNLGMRYNRLSDNELAGNASFDVCSFNCYQTNPSERLDILKNKDTRPGLIGEWHVAGSEMSHYAAGLVWAKTQAERAKACRNYLERVFSHPCAVGAHYFEMNDQPVLGRFDGECMQHGLITLCNQEYRETGDMLSSLARHMYTIADGLETAGTANIKTENIL